jgi:hypothetical protein
MDNNPSPPIPAQIVGQKPVIRGLFGSPDIVVIAPSSSLLEFWLSVVLISFLDWTTALGVIKVVGYTQPRNVTDVLH